MMKSPYPRWRIGAPLSNCLSALLPALASVADSRAAKPRSRTVALSSLLSFPCPAMSEDSVL